MNKVLVSMAFDPEVAKDVGVDSAIILQNIVFWLAKNKANNKYIYEGKVWTYNSVRAFKELFNWLTEKQINNCLNKLIEKNYIITGNFNKTAYDRTKWYALGENYQMGELILPNGEIHFTKWENGNDQMVKPIPDINTYINTDIKQEREKKNYSDKQLLLNLPKVVIEEMITKFNCDEKMVIRKGEELHDWSLANGKNKKDWVATLRNAIRKDYGERLSKEELVRQKCIRQMEEMIKDFPVGTVHNLGGWLNEIRHKAGLHQKSHAELKKDFPEYFEKLDDKDNKNPSVYYGIPDESIYRT